MVSSVSRPLISGGIKNEINEINEVRVFVILSPILKGQISQKDIAIPTLDPPQDGHSVGP